MLRRTAAVGASDAPAARGAPHVPGATTAAHPRAARRPSSVAREALPLAPLLLLYLIICALSQPGDVGVRDEPDLLAAARRLLDGTYAVTEPPIGPRAFLWHGPGLPALLAPLVALELPLPALRFAGPVLLAAAVVVVHRALRVRLARRPALAWTYAFGLYVPAFTMLDALHKEPLAMLLVALAMLGLSRGLGERRTLPVVGAGVAFGALTMVRLEYGWVLVGLLAAGAAWMLARRRSRAARAVVLSAAVGLLCCTPWLLYTHSVTGKAFYWGDSGGLSLFWMSPTGNGENGQWHSPLDVPVRADLIPYVPFFHRLERLHPLQRDTVLRRVAIENIRARPLAYVRNIAANAGRILFFAPMRTPRPWHAIATCVLFNGLLLAALAVAGRRLWRRRRSAPPEAGAFALFAGAAVAIHLVASASPRMLFPVVPVLVWLAATNAGLPSARRRAQPVR